MGDGIAFLGVTLALGCLLQCLAVSGCTEKDRLVRDLTQNYLTAVEPDKTVLKIGIAPLCSRFDKATNALVTNVWEKLGWTDKRLRWLPKEYNGIESIRLPSKLVWTPDLKLYNSVTAADERDRTNVVVYHDGSVIWVPSSVYHTLCSVGDSGSGPNCQFRIASWTYDADMLPLQLDENPVDASEYLNATCPLTFESATAVIKTRRYPCCKELYSHAEFNIRFKP